MQITSIITSMWSTPQSRHLILRLRPRDVKITAGIITDIVGTVSTINTLDTNYFDGYFAKITAGVVLAWLTYAISTVDITCDAVDVKVTTGRLHHWSVHM